MAPGNIRALYEKHPLRLETIVARVRKQRKSLEGISELDLAFDAQSATTDQNHVGGVAFAVALARAAGTGPAMRVLDLGCGLGGSMRLLAYFYGCKATGYDVSEERIAEAIELTRLVKLEDFVDFRHADLVTCDLPRERFDVIWGQSSWTHIQGKDEFLKKWVETLNAPGIVAFEDLSLLHKPEGGTEEARALARFEEDSMSQVVALREWKQILADCSLSVTVEEDLSRELISEERKLTRSDNAISGDKGSNEREKTNLLLELAEKGILGYFRLVAKRD